MQADAHPPDQPARQLVLGDRLPEDAALCRVGQRVPHGGVHHADGARRGLQSPGREAFHLQVEAAPFLPDQGVGGQPVVIEDELERVQAPIAEGRDRPAAQDATRALGVLESVGGWECGWRSLAETALFNSASVKQGSSPAPRP